MARGVRHEFLLLRLCSVVGRLRVGSRAAITDNRSRPASDLRRWKNAIINASTFHCRFSSNCREGPGLGNFQNSAPIIEAYRRHDPRGPLLLLLRLWHKISISRSFTYFTSLLHLLQTRARAHTHFFGPPVPLTNGGDVGGSAGKHNYRNHEKC